MTRNYTEQHLNMETKEFENVANWSFTVYPQDNTCLTVSRNGNAKTVKVVEDREFIYKLQKTQIKARGGATELFKFIDDALYENFCSCMAWKILRHAFYNCKEMK